MTLRPMARQAIHQGGPRLWQRVQRLDHGVHVAGVAFVGQAGGARLVLREHLERVAPRHVIEIRRGALRREIRNQPSECAERGRVQFHNALQEFCGRSARFGAVANRHAGVRQQKTLDEL